MEVKCSQVCFRNRRNGNEIRGDKKSEETERGF